MSQMATSSFAGGVVEGKSCSIGIAPRLPQQLSSVKLAFFSNNLLFLAAVGPSPGGVGKRGSLIGPKVLIGIMQEFQLLFV